MTYPEGEHPHQSDSLKFLPDDYVPYTKVEGMKIYGVTVAGDDGLSVRYQAELPTFGGYVAKESFYGNPSYCANATRHHRKHLAEYGVLPHLVFFDSAEEAERLGFKRCKRCQGKDEVH